MIPRELLRARILLRSVLPLLKIVMRDQPETARLFRGLSAAAQIRTRAGDAGACLRFEDGELSVEDLASTGRDAAVQLIFSDLAALNSFFAGRLVMPRVSGLLHPLLIVKLTRLLAALRILHPQDAPASRQQRLLRVKLLLYLVTHALAELHRGGYPPMVELVAASPERVYQWSVGSADAPEVGAYLRMHRGRIKAGRGVYPHRRPFVHFLFPDVDAALDVLTRQDSQMRGVRSGQVQTLGSPEYTRKISLLMQKVDELLVSG